jgi:hypothetical protein
VRIEALIAVTVKITLFWDMTHCRLAKMFTKGMERLSEYSLLYTDHVDNDGIRFLLIVGKHLPYYKE